MTDRYVETEKVETKVDNNEGGTEAVGAGAGALAGAGVGAIVGGPVGAAVGGVVGAVGGAIAGEAAEGTDEAGAGVGAGGGAVAGAVIGGALAGPPGAVVGGAVGAGAGAGAGDKTEEAAKDEDVVETTTTTTGYPSPTDPGPGYDPIARSNQQRASRTRWHRRRVRSRVRRRAQWRAMSNGDTGGGTNVRARRFDADRTDEVLELDDALAKRPSERQLLWIDITGEMPPDLVPRLAETFELDESTERQLAKRR